MVQSAAKPEIRTETRGSGDARRVPEDTVLSSVVSDELTTFFAHADSNGREVPAFVTRELTRCLQCELLAHGFVRVRLRRLPPPTDADAAAADPLPEDQPLLADLYAASVRSRIAMGDRAELGVLRIGQLVDPGEAAFVTERRCTMIDGVSLHANVAGPKGDRRRLEKLCRYIARPPVSTQRLSKLPDGRLLYRLKRKWRNGTTHVVFEQIELV